MTRYLLLLSVTLTLILTGNPAWSLEIVDAVITTAVIDREPVDKVEVFPIQNGTLYCFTRVTGALAETAVYHLWYRDNQLLSRVQLPVNSPDWRTWSAKSFLPEWQGEWRVEIQDMNGNLLQTVKFQLR